LRKNIRVIRPACFLRQERSRDRGLPVGSALNAVTDEAAAEGVPPLLMAHPKAKPPLSMVGHANWSITGMPGRSSRRLVEQRLEKQMRAGHLL
jgi:hypothetical protein